MIGNSGNGSLTQGGTATNSAVTLILGANAGSSGTYTLNGGNLTASTETVGATGSGVFVQNGGTNKVSNLTLGHGSYALNGGTVTAQTINYGANSSLSINGGNLSFGQFVQTGGSLTAGQPGELPDPFVLGTGGVGMNFALEGGTFASPTITLNSGAALNLNLGGTLVSSTINVNGGLLIVSNISLDSGSPVFNLPVGTGAQPQVNLGSGELHGINVSLGSTAAGTYTYTQNLPVTLGANTLSIGVADGATATYILPAGQTLNARVNLGGWTNLPGAGVGHFIQTGGTNLEGTYIHNGTYTQSGGTLGAAVYVSNGTFEQDGGDDGYGYSSVIELGITPGAGTATYTMTGGSIYGDGTILVGYNGTGVFNQSGGSVTGQSLQIGQGGNASIKGTYRYSGGTLDIGVGDYIGGTFIVENYSGAVREMYVQGILSLAGATETEKAGSLSMTDGYEQTGELDIGLGGPDAESEYGVLSVTGGATLGGKLVVSLTNGFVPLPGEQFEILAVDKMTGTFSQVVLPAGMELGYTANGVIVTEVPEPAMGSVLLAAGVWGIMHRRRRSAAE
ncbi:MAG: hypothetical protein ACTHN5_01735 [Phycisphaerae bacterium]